LPRKVFGPDANGNGPDGKPWDAARRQQREAARGAPVNTAPAPHVDPSSAAPAAPAPADKPTE
jgi:hypothetical protein